MWQEVLGNDLIIRPRRSRIYYRGHFDDYPLKVQNALFNVGPYEAARIVLSFHEELERQKSSTGQAVP